MINGSFCLEFLRKLFTMKVKKEREDWRAYRTFIEYTAEKTRRIQAEKARREREKKDG